MLLIKAVYQRLSNLFLIKLFIYDCPMLLIKVVYRRLSNALNKVVYRRLSNAFE